MSTLKIVCTDQVLAARVQGTAALAALCHTLQVLHLTSKLPPPSIPAASSLFNLACSAAGDSEKLRMHAAHALGSLLSALHTHSESEETLQQGASSLCTCLHSENVKVQWAACEAASWALASLSSSSTPISPATHASSDVVVMIQRKLAIITLLVDELVALVSSGSNLRTRTLAVTALQALDPTAPCLQSSKNLTEKIMACLGGIVSGTSGDDFADFSVGTGHSNPRALVEVAAKALAHFEGSNLQY